MDIKKFNLEKLGPMLILWTIFIALSGFVLLSWYFGIESFNSVMTKNLAPVPVLVISTIAYLAIIVSPGLSKMSKVIVAGLTIYAFYKGVAYLIAFKVFDIFVLGSFLVLIYGLYIVSRRTTNQNTASTINSESLPRGQEVKQSN